MPIFGKTTYSMYRPFSSSTVLFICGDVFVYFFLQLTTLPEMLCFGRADVKGTTSCMWPERLC